MKTNLERVLDYLWSAGPQGATNDEDIVRIAGTYHAWQKSGTLIRNDEMMDYDLNRKDHSPSQNQKNHSSGFKDVPGFCKSVTVEEIRAQGYVLTLERYVGAAEMEEDGEPFEKKMARLRRELEVQFEEGTRLESIIEIMVKLVRGEVRVSEL